MSLLLTVGCSFARADTPDSLHTRAGRPQLSLDPEKPPTQYLYSNWDDQDGLPTTTVNAVYQDEDRYIWVATQNGLARFNGHDFKVYSPRTNNGIESNQINDFEKAEGEGFWIGTNGGGLSRYRNGAFRSYTEEDGLVNDQVERLYRDERGVLWIMTVEGVSRFEDGEFTNFTREDGLLTSRTFSAVDGPDGYLLVATDSALVRTRPEEPVRFEADPRYPELVDKNVIDLLVDREDRLWAATLDNGLYRFNGGETVHYTTELRSAGASVLYEDRHGAIWIGTYNGGLLRYYDGELESYRQEDGLTANRVDAFLLDREENLWIGMHSGGGLGQLRSSKITGFTTAEGLTDNTVVSITEDPDGNVWIATENSGLNRLSDGAITPLTAPEHLPNNSLHTVLADREGTVWYGGMGTGLCRITETGYDCITADDGLLHNNVFSLYEDSKGRIWVGTIEGLNVYDDGELTSFTTEDGLSGTLLTSIREDRTGTLWIGTLENGLNRYRDGAFTSFTDEGPLPTNQVITLETDVHGHLWIGTTSGLCRRADGEFDCVTVENGLFTNQIIQLQFDDSGTLWMGSLNGLGRAALSDLEAVVEGRRDSITSTVYGYGDGLPSTEGQGGIQPSTWAAQNGDLWFATTGGAAVFDPDALPMNKKPPQPVIEELLVEDASSAVRDTVTYQPGTGNFEFRIGALTFVNNEATTLQYTLDGYQNGWSTVNGERAVYFSNLEPGTYTFRLRARNHDGIWSREQAAMTFTVQPYFYQTYWFYVLVAFGLIGSGFGAYKFRVRQIRQREEQLSRLVDEQTKELQHREEELEELNESLEEEVERQLEVILEERERAERKKIQLEERKKYERELIEAKEKAEESAKLKATILMNMSHEIRTPLTSILGFAEVLEEEIEGDHLQFAELIRKSGERLLDTLNSVLDMSQLEANSMTIESTRLDVVELVEETLEMFEAQAQEDDLYLKVETNTDGDSVWAHLDESFLDRIVDNLVGNALKFTEEGGVTVRVEARSERLHLEVQDTGIGISDDFLPQLFDAFKQESTGLRRSHEGTGLGLAITKRLVELLDGTITVESEEGEGTTFIIELPREVGSAQPDHDPLDREDVSEGEPPHVGADASDDEAALGEGTGLDGETRNGHQPPGDGNTGSPTKTPTASETHEQSR